MGSVLAVGNRQLIGEQLIREALITEAQLQEALQLQKQTGAKIVATLIGLGHIDQAAFLGFLARQPGIASIHLSGFDIPRPILQFIPAEFARAHEVIPMDRMGSVLTVGMACPLDVSVIQELETLTELRISALLVAPDAIQVALEKYYPRRDEAPAADAVALNPEAPEKSALRQISATLTLEGITAMVRGVSSLPAMPDTVQRIQSAVDDPAMGVNDVAEILKHDPALAAKVISLANSPVHGLRYQVTSVETATAMLGLREVYTVAVAAALVNQFAGAPQFDYAAHWRRSSLCGTLAKILARATRRDFGTGVFAAGLLHDIGRVVLAEVVPAPYGAINHAVPDNDLIQVELDAFGIAHPEVGFLVARNWALPIPLGESIRFHHQPERAQFYPEMVGLVALAARLTDHLEHPEGVPLADCIAAVNAFGIEEHQLTGILDVARALSDSSTT